VTLKIKIHAKLDYGQRVGIVGGAVEFGAWNPEQPLLLRWTEGDVWTGTVELAAVGQVEYKLIVRNGAGGGGGFAWEQFQGGNRVVNLLLGGSVLSVAGEIGGELKIATESAPAAGVAADVRAGGQVSEAHFQHARDAFLEARAAAEASNNASHSSQEQQQQQQQQPQGDSARGGSRDFYAEAKARALGGYGNGGGYSGTHISFQERVQQALTAAESASNAAYSSPSTSHPPYDGGDVRGTGDSGSTSRAASMDESYHSSSGAPQPLQQEGSRDFYAEAKARAAAGAPAYYDRVPLSKPTAPQYSSPPPPSPPRPPPAPARAPSYEALHTLTDTSYNGAPPPAFTPSEPAGYYTPPPPGAGASAPEDTGYYDPAYSYVPPSEVTYAYASPLEPPPPPPVVFPTLPEGTCRDIVEGDAACRSWPEKLQLVAGVIGAGAGVGRPLDPETVAACSVYLRWVGTCVVGCGEDSGDQRPDGATAAARDIFISLETAAGELYTPGRAEVGEVERTLIRQIQPWLPSFSSEFSGGVPLARIGAITQRGDIPEPLRQEIR
jgi:hypothetical protein